MDATELVLIGLVIAVFILTVGLVLTNRKMAAFAAKALEHALAESDAQREHMRTRAEIDRQELLLREARAREKQYAPRQPSNRVPEGDPDILVSANSNLN